MDAETNNNIMHMTSKSRNEIDVTTAMTSMTADYRHDVSRSYDASYSMTSMTADYRHDVSRSYIDASYSMTSIAVNYQHDVIKP